MSKMKVLKAAGPLLVTAAAVLFLLPPTRANQSVRTLGNDSLGETVKQFRIQHPKAACGRPTSLDPNPQNLVHSEKMDDTDCCLNDKDSLAQVSQFPIVNLDDCAVHALFRKGKLYTLTYMLDVRSIQIVLDDFVKLYGPPTRMLNSMMRDTGDAAQLTFVDWWEGMTILQIYSVTLNKNDFAKYSLHKTGEPPLHLVCVDLRNSLIGATLKRLGKAGFTSYSSCVNSLSVAQSGHDYRRPPPRHA